MALCVLFMTLRTSWFEVGSVDHSATETLHHLHPFLHYLSYWLNPTGDGILFMTLWHFVVCSWLYGTSKDLMVWSRECWPLSRTDTSPFTSLSTLFKSYRDNGSVIMKGSMQWSANQSWAEFHLQCDSNPGPHDLKTEVQTTQPPWYFSMFILLLLTYLKTAGWVANNVDPDQTKYSEVPDLVIHYLCNY